MNPSARLLSPVLGVRRARPSKLYSHPLSPFTHTPLAHRVSGGLELMHRLAKEYEKPEFKFIRSGRRRRRRGAAAGSRSRSRSAGLLRFKRFTDDLPMLTKMKDQPTVLVVAPLSGHHSTLLRETVRELLKRPQGVRHRLDRRAHGAAGRRPVPPGRLRGLRAGVHPPRRAATSTSSRSASRPCRCWPRDRADGQRRRADAAHDDDDGRPIDARKSPTAVNNLRDEQELRLVREQRDLPRADQLSRAAGRGSTPASCSTAASSR